MGGPTAPPPMPSINDPFKAVDFSQLPPLRRYTAGDGAHLAYRYYPPGEPKAAGSVVLVHGSAASSESMHVLAQAYARAGYAAYGLDMRGHGASGPKGHIAYIGQLDDDLMQFMHAVAPPQPATLVGFSAGGGFALRIAGSAQQQMFQSYLLLSPFLGQDAPNYRPHSGGWINVGVPRVAAVSMLNALGVHALDDLTVVRFALNEQAQRFLTPSYSFAMAANFRPRADYVATMRAVKEPCAVLAGAADEAFDTPQLEAVVRSQRPDWPVALLPGIGHIPLTIDARAVDAAVRATDSLRAKGAKGV
ncbi:MAG: alpha/beta fold hydrolase [Ramlibacter sp.]|nr:alpha/beta fold hydrolase [Ramlibacter sp.]